MGGLDPRNLAGAYCSGIAGLTLQAVLLSAVPCHAETPGPTPAAKNEQMLFVDDPAKWTQPRRVLPPTYPPALPAKGVTGFVDLELQLAKAGFVERIVSINSTPKEPQFETSVQDVLEHWTFHVPISNDCKPQAFAGNTRVWFEIKNGEPSISVSNRPSLPSSTARVSPPMKNLKEVLATLGQNYPRAARRKSAEANMYVVMVMDGDSGKTVEVRIAEYIGLSEFFGGYRKAIEKAFSIAEFSVGEEHKGQTRSICRTVAFKIEP